MALAAVSVAVAACGSSPAPSPSPVIARVGSIPITRHLFDIRLASATASITQGGGPGPSGGSGAMTATLRAQVIKSLIIDAVIADAAGLAHVAATGHDVDAEVAADARAAGGNDALTKQLGEAGGSMDQLTDEIRSRLNEQRVENLLAQQRAAEALGALAAGDGFATVAREYSDDETSASRGGDLGTVTPGQLGAGDAAFMDGVLALRAGQLTSSPIRDRAGYEIVRVDSVIPAGRSLHRILVAAPNPYTVRERPSWFAEAVLSRLQGYCGSGQVHVYLPGAAPICVVPSASASSPRANTP